MREIKRAVHFDFHTMPGIYDIGQGFDAEEIAQRLSDAHVDYINFFAACNLGFCYFPTKVGTPYPGLKSDMLGDMVRACHKRDIGVTAYISVGLMHEQTRNHPEWANVNKDGQLIYGDRTANFFRNMCYNAPGFRSFLAGLVKEICAYDIDGLFCDNMVYRPCYCNTCTEDMLAHGIDINDDDAVLAFNREVLMRCAQDIKAIVGPDRYLYMNGMPYYAFRDIDTHIEIECLPSGGWGYDFFWPHAAYARNIQDTVLYMTGRFQASWGDFGGYKTKASIENDLYDGLCNGFPPSVGDHIHPATGIVGDIYRDVGDIYEHIRRYEPYTLGARAKTDIGVITNSAGFLGNDFLGLGRMLGELKQGFDIVHQDMDIERFSLIILPDNMIVNESLKAKLRAHLDRGGKILSTGFGGLAVQNTDGADVQLRVAETLPGLSDGLVTSDPKTLSFAFALPEYEAVLDGVDLSNVSYFNFTHTPEGTAKMPWAMYKQGVLMTARRPEYVRARYVKAYFDRHWDGLHGYYYTPPEKETGHAAAIRCGNVAHICFSIFEAYYDKAMREHKLLVKQLIDELHPEPLIRPVADIPSTARVTLTGKDDYLLLHVKASYPEPRGKFDIVEEHNVLKAGAQVAVHGRYDKVCLLPDEKPVEWRYEDGYTVITLPEIVGYDMFLLR